MHQQPVNLTFKSGNSLEYLPKRWKEDPTFRHLAHNRSPIYQYNFSANYPQSFGALSRFNLQNLRIPPEVLSDISHFSLRGYMEEVENLEEVENGFWGEEEYLERMKCCYNGLDLPMKWPDLRK